MQKLPITEIKLVDANAMDFFAYTDKHTAFSSLLDSQRFPLRFGTVLCDVTCVFVAIETFDTFAIDLFCLIRLISYLSSSWLRTAFRCLVPLPSTVLASSLELLSESVESQFLFIVVRFTFELSFVESSNLGLQIVEGEGCCTLHGSDDFTVVVRKLIDDMRNQFEICFSICNVDELHSSSKEL